MTVLHRQGDVCHADTLVECHALDACARLVLEAVDEQIAAVAVLEDVGRQLGRDDRDPASVAFVKAVTFG